MGQSLPRQKLPRSEIRRLQRYVSFSEDEIQEWYLEFCHSLSQPSRPHRRHHHHHHHRHHHARSMALSEEDFVRVYNSVYPGQGDEFARHIFRTFDLDGNHRVDFREFLIGLSFNGSEDMQKKLSWAFQLYDVHRSGFITLDSMTQIVRAVFKMIGHPVTGDNDLTVSAEQMAQELFHELDQDRDQKVSWLEFREGALRNPTVLKLLQCSPPGAQEQPDFEERVDDDAFVR